MSLTAKGLTRYTQKELDDTNRLLGYSLPSQSSDESVPYQYTKDYIDLMKRANDESISKFHRLGEQTKDADLLRQDKQQLQSKKHMMDLYAFKKNLDAKHDMQNNQSAYLHDSMIKAHEGGNNSMDSVNRLVASYFGRA